MIDYEEPLVSGIHAATAPQVAAALHATAQLLNFYSFVLGRRVEKRFKMSDLFEAEEEFGRLICPLSDGDRRAAYETIIKVLVQSIRSRFSADAALHAEASDGESIDRSDLENLSTPCRRCWMGMTLRMPGNRPFLKD